MAQAAHPPNPFRDDIHLGGSANLPGVPEIHESELMRILAQVRAWQAPDPGEPLSPRPGESILLKAPRAGYGKTHLLARLREALRNESVDVIPMPMDPARPLDWQTALASTIRQAVEDPFQSDRRISHFEESGRFLLARLVLHLLDEGQLSPEEIPADGTRLAARFEEVFAKQPDSGALAWLEQSSSDLSRRASARFTRTLGLSMEELAYWARLVVDFHLRRETALSPLQGLPDAEAKSRLLQWLRIAAFHRPLLLVVDGLDGFHGSEKAGMRIAEFLTAIREGVPRAISLIALNEEVWESVFAHDLPTAWADRIAGDEVSLAPIPREAAIRLVEHRLALAKINEHSSQSLVARFDEELRAMPPSEPLYPRAVLRRAGQLWQQQGVDGPTILSPLSPAPESAPESAPEAEVPDLRAIERQAPEPEEPESFPRDAGAERIPTAFPGPAALLKSLFSAPRPKEAPAPPPRESHPVRNGAASRPGFDNPFPPPPETSASGEPPPSDLEENPFFAPPEPAPVPTPGPAGLPAPRLDRLPDIESIIAEIRGSGGTVASKAPPNAPPNPPLFERDEQEPEAKTKRPDPFIAVEALRDPDASCSGDEDEEGRRPHTPIGKFFGFADEGAPFAPSRERSLQQELNDHEEALRCGGGLAFDLPRIERLILTVGSRHPGLSQTEEHQPGSRSVCARWQVHGQSVLIGFEPPGNAYFWSQLLQQSLSAGAMEKIAAFSHRSEPFDPSVFSSFGFAPSLIRSRIDIIEMGDRELAMLYASAGLLGRHVGSSEEAEAFDTVTRYLDPLWRRVSRTLG